MIRCSIVFCKLFSITQVVAAGPGRLDEAGKAIPLSVNVGDTVIIPEYGGKSMLLLPLNTCIFFPL